jgi:hypothetical protein
MIKRTSMNNSDSHLTTIEEYLAGTLKPVAPRQDFVQRLRGRIHLPPREEIAVRLRDWRRLFWVFGGVISGALVLLTIARALFHLFGRKQIG